MHLVHLALLLLLRNHLLQRAAALLRRRRHLGLCRRQLVVVAADQLRLLRLHLEEGLLQRRGHVARVGLDVLHGLLVQRLHLAPMYLLRRVQLLPEVRADRDGLLVDGRGQLGLERVVARLELSSLGLELRDLALRLVQHAQPGSSRRLRFCTARVAAPQTQASCATHSVCGVSTFLAPKRSLAVTSTSFHCSNIESTLACCASCARVSVSIARSDAWTSRLRS